MAHRVKRRKLNDNSEAIKYDNDDISSDSDQDTDLSAESYSLYYSTSDSESSSFSKHRTKYKTTSKTKSKSKSKSKRKPQKRRDKKRNYSQMKKDNTTQKKKKNTKKNKNKYVYNKQSLLSEFENTVRRYDLNRNIKELCGLHSMLPAIQIIEKHKLLKSKDKYMANFLCTATGSTTLCNHLINKISNLYEKYISKTIMNQFDAYLNTPKSYITAHIGIKFNGIHDVTNQNEFMIEYKPYPNVENFYNKSEYAIVSVKSIKKNTFLRHIQPSAGGYRITKITARGAFLPITSDIYLKIEPCNNDSFVGVGFIISNNQSLNRPRIFVVQGHKYKMSILVPYETKGSMDVLIDGIKSNINCTVNTHAKLNARCTIIVPITNNNYNCIPQFKNYNNFSVPPIMIPYSCNNNNNILPFFNDNYSSKSPAIMPVIQNENRQAIRNHTKKDNENSCQMLQINDKKYENEYNEIDAMKSQTFRNNNNLNGLILPPLSPIQPIYKYANSINYSFENEQTNLYYQNNNNDYLCNNSFHFGPRTK